MKWLVVLAFLLPAAGQAEIYKWTDKYGQTHYGEEPPEAIESEEISEKLKQSENYVNFRDVGDIQFYNPPPNRKEIRLVIDVELVKYKLSAETRRTIERQVRNIYQAYVYMFGWDPRPARAIKIKIFGDYAEFEQYQIDKTEGHITSRSHYSPTRKEVVMLGTEFTDATLHVLYHEASHAILDMAFPIAPKWINEGLAEVFEFIDGDNGRTGFRTNKAWVEIMQHKLREGSLRHIRDYLSVSDVQWHNSPGQVERTYYIVAWSMMAYMLSTDRNVAAMEKIIQGCKKTPWWQPGRLVELFAANYPGGINKLDADWRQWIRKAR